MATTTRESQPPPPLNACDLVAHLYNLLYIGKPELRTLIRSQHPAAPQALSHVEASCKTDRSFDNTYRQTRYFLRCFALKPSQVDAGLVHLIELWKGNQDDDDDGGEAFGQDVSSENTTATTTSALPSAPPQNRREGAGEEASWNWTDVLRKATYFTG